jgi:hypothetical protein
LGSEQKDNSNKLEHCREADFGREVEEFMREERKRKDAENLADDLFNAERVTSKLTSTELKRPSSLIIIMMRLLFEIAVQV